MTNPQIWTSETVAVRALAALGIAHPAEFSAALEACGVTGLGPAVPDSFVCEEKRIDLKFETESGKTCFIEAKTVSEIGADQIDRYQALFPDAIPVLLAPNLNAPDVRRVLEARSSVTGVSWSDLLSRLIPVNPIAKLLDADVGAIATQPGSHIAARIVLDEAVQNCSVPDGVVVEVRGTATNRPSIDVDVPTAWTFAQVEPPRGGDSLDHYTVTVGFEVTKGEYDDPELMKKFHSALEEGWSVVEELEKHGDFEISRRLGHVTEEIRKLGHSETPYKARGYRDSYHGYKLKPMKSAQKATEVAAKLVHALTPISHDYWGVVEAKEA